MIPCSLPGEPGAPHHRERQLRFVRRIHRRRARRRVGVERAVICGVSFGGLIALRYAARRPDRTDALILVSTPGPRWKVKPRSRALHEVADAEQPPVLRRRVRPILAGAARHVSGCQRSGSGSAPAPWRGVLAAPAIPSRMSRRAQLAEQERFDCDCASVKAPTLVITGERDLDRVVQYDETMDYVALIPGRAVSAARADRTSGHDLGAGSFCRRSCRVSTATYD